MSKEIARLRDSEVLVPLPEYLGYISVYLGSTAFTLMQTEERQPAGVFMANRETRRMPLLSYATTTLVPGNLVRVGKINGIEIYDQRGELDDERMRQIGDYAMQRGLMSDVHLSRRHAEFYVASPAEIIVRDLGSTNETWIEADSMPEPIRRLSPRRRKGGHLRAVQ